MTLISEVLAELADKTARISTFELSRDIVMEKHKRIRPFDPALGFEGRPSGTMPSNLQFDARMLLIAAAKSELAHSFDLGTVREQACSLWLRFHNQLVFDGGSLRLHAPKLFARKDASAAFDSGRLGEGVAHLFMASQGYVYWDHLPTLLEHLQSQRAVTHAESTRVAQILAPAAGKYPGDQPDFIFEDPAGNVALLEAKGSFVRTGSRYSAKQTVLRDALKQLTAWSTLISPVPSKLFAVGTFLRHDQDIGHEPSMLAWVDPPGDEGSDAMFHLPPDAIRRGHYGAILAMIGLPAVGHTLRARGTLPRRKVSLMAVRIGARQFIFGPALEPRLLLQSFPPWALFQRPFHVFGIDLALFRQFRHCLDSSNNLLEVPPFEEQEAKFDGIAGLMLRDGTFVGELDHIGRLHSEPVEL